MKSIQKALQLACTNHDAAGARVLLMEGTHQWAQGGQGSVTNPPWVETSGDHWVAIERDPAADFDTVTVTREDGSGTSPWLQLPSPPSGTAHVRLRIRNLRIAGKGLAVQSGTNTTVEAWLDGCEETSPFTSEIHIGAWDTETQAIGASPELVRVFVTGGKRHHTINGWLGWTLVRGCALWDYISIALQASADHQGVCNLNIETQRQHDGVAGWFDVTTGTFDITVPQTGRIRVKATNSGIADFKPAAAKLVDLELVRVTVSGDTASSGANNGTYKVKAAGYASGLPYVDLEKTGGVQSLSTQITIEVSVNSGSNWYPYDTAIHPDVLQINANVTNYLFSNVRSHDIGGSQGLFSNSHNMTRCAFVNIVTGTEGNSWFAGTGSWNHVLLRHITCAGTWLFERDSSIFSLADSEVYDCAFDTATYTTTTGTAPLPSASHNHFEDTTNGTSFGSNVTNGASGTFWADASHLASGDYSASSSYATSHPASQTWSRPSAYTSSGPDRGAWANVSKTPGQGGGW